MNKIILMLLLLISTNVIAADKGYQICSIAGFFTGQKDPLLSGVASRDQNLQNITFDKECTDAWGNGYGVGTRARAYVGTFPSNENNKADYIIYIQAMEYKKQVYDFILSGIKEPI